MTQTIIDTWLNDTKIKLIQNYDKLGLRASGNWAKSLKNFSSKNDRGYNLGISGKDYTYYLENGRSPNRNQDPEYLKRWVGWAGSTFLKQWVKDKQINVNPYAVAWKIGSEGIKVPNPNNTGGLVSDIVTDKRIKELLKDLTFFKIKEVKSELIKTFK